VDSVGMIILSLMKIQLIQKLFKRGQTYENDDAIDGSSFLTK